MCLLEKFVGFQRNYLKNSSYLNNILSGSIHVNEMEILDLLHYFSEHDLVFEYKSSRGVIYYLDDIKVGDELFINLSIRKKKFKFYLNIDDLIKFNQTTAPDFYYIYKNDFLSNENKVIPELRSLSQIYSLIAFLKDAADYSETIHSELKLIFIQSKIVAFKVNFKSENIDENYNFIGEFETHFKEGSIGRDEKIAMFKNILIKFLTDEGVSFSNILSNWNIIYDNYKRSYALYLDGFSIEKIKSEIDNERINLTEKLHTILSGLNSRIISVPIGFFLIISQFDYTGQNSIKNIALASGAVIFFLVEYFLLADNKELVDNIFIIANEINDKNQVIKDSSFLEKLKKESQNVKNKICAINIITAIMAGISIAMCVILLYKK